MGKEKITYSDVKEYENLFTSAPSFILEGMARRNTNLVLKFNSSVKSHLGNLSQDQKNKLYMILSSDVEDLQSVMAEAYSRSGKKQYKILANPKYKSFIESNLASLRKIM